MQTCKSNKSFYSSTLSYLISTSPNYHPPLTHSVEHVALLRISQLLLLFITLAVGELDLQALEIDAVQHAHIDACHAREEVRICHCKSDITPFSRTGMEHTDAARHAARTARAAEIMCDFRLGAEGIGLRG